MFYRNSSNKKNNRLKQSLALTTAMAGILLSACSGDGSGPAPEASDDSTLRALISAANITGDPTTGRTLPSITDKKAQLGKKLFFTKGLGGNDDSACVTCHHPVLGGGDNLSLPIGVGAETPDLLGSGRFHDSNAVANDGGVFDGGPTVPRNAPTTFNLAMWDQALFHDGRIESLGKTSGVNGDDGQGIRTPDTAFDVADPDAGSTLASAQSRFPVTSAEEMRGFTFEAGNSNAQLRSALEVKLTADGGWDSEFTDAFGDATISYGRIADAIAEYERSQVFVNTPWKAYVEGDDAAISDAAKKGAIMFYSSIEDGGANCVSCHAGDFFTDEQYHVLATPQIGRGKGNDNGTMTNDDFGRFRESGDAADMYRFRTPTLTNVEVTGPWGHAGAYTSLENMVSHMLDPAKAVANYDFGQLDPTIQAVDMLTNTQFALNQLAKNRTSNVSGVHKAVAHTSDDVSNIVEFLKTLTDPCVQSRDCLAPWIPGAGDTDPDGLRINAINSGGSFL